MSKHILRGLRLSANRNESMKRLAMLPHPGPISPSPGCLQPIPESLGLYIYSRCPVLCTMSSIFSVSSVVSLLLKKSSTAVSVSRAAATISTTMVTAKKYVLDKHFQGEPKRSDFKIVEEELPPLQNGGRIIRIIEKLCAQNSSIY